MSERLSGADQPRQQPPADGERRERPGYPPPGHDETMAALAAAEAAAGHGDAEAELDGDLAALERGAETPSEREVRLGEFVAEHFAEVCPPEHLDSAVAECLIFEDDCRILFGEPGLTLCAEDAADPALREAIETQIIAQAAEISANEETIAALADDERDEATVLARQDEELVPGSNAEREATETAHPEIDVPETEEARDLALAREERRTAALQATESAELQSEEEKAEDLTEIRQLQAEFEELRAEHGTIGALRTLLEPGRLKSPEMRAKVERAVATAEALVGAVPGKEVVVSRLLDQSELNLAATSTGAAFADFLSAVDDSEDLTEDEKEALRRVLNEHDDIDTGSDVKKAFAEGRETITHPDGTTEVLPYDEEHQLEVMPGVMVYPDGELIRGTASFGGRSFPFEASIDLSGTELTERLNFSVYHTINESAGLTGGTRQGLNVTQGAAAMDLSNDIYETQAVREARLALENMIDRIDASTTLLTESQIRQLEWGHQWFMPQRDVLGDAAFGDNDELARARTLGGHGHDGPIWDAEDRLNEENFVIACQFIHRRALTGTSEPDVAALLAHIDAVHRANAGGERRAA